MDPLTIALIAALGIGTIGNIFGGKQEYGIKDTLRNLLEKYANLTPEQVAEAIKQLQQPMSQALQNTVLSRVQASMGQRGLADAPGLIAEATAQALGPFQLQQQQLASQNYFDMMQLPLGVAFPASSGGADLAGLAQLLSKQLGK